MVRVARRAGQLDGPGLDKLVSTDGASTHVPFDGLPADLVSTVRPPPGYLDEGEDVDHAGRVRLSAYLGPPLCSGHEAVKDPLRRPAVGFEEVPDDPDLVGRAVEDSVRLAGASVGPHQRLELVRLKMVVLGPGPLLSGSLGWLWDHTELGLAPGDSAPVHPLVELLVVQRLRRREEAQNLGRGSK